MVLGVVHRARNNLSADVQAGLQHLLGSVVRPGQQAVSANASDEPLYEARLSAQRVSVAAPHLCTELAQGLRGRAERDSTASRSPASAIEPC